MWLCSSYPARHIGLGLAQNRHARSAAEDHKVSVDQGVFRFLLLLLLAFRGDQLLAAQRRKTDNESAGLDKACNIEVDRIAHRCVRITHDRLAWANQN